MVSRWIGRRSVSLLQTAALTLIFAFSHVVEASQRDQECKERAEAPIPVDVYIPLDNWVYPALNRLQGLGYLDTAFLGIRPWTRRSVQRMLAGSAQAEGIERNAQAFELLATLQREFGKESNDGEDTLSLSCEALYTRLQGIGGLTLRDSYHLGQTIVNDYGRPYQPGFNTVDGAAGSVQYKRFSLYVRGEYQHAPSAAGYSPTLASTLSGIDTIGVPAGPVLTTIPVGPIATTDDFRIVEANVSYRLLNHQISFGKSDHWFAPTVGGALTYSNNAENMYAFQIDRTEPLHIPLLSRLVGPFRYDFFVGSLKGHSSPNDPWMHVEKVNFKPTPNVEFGFERSVIWGGKGHEPITIHTFLKSFISTANVTGEQKFSPDDPGARFSSFDFSWRLPWLTHWITLYSDSMAHDDVNPIDAPRHASVRPGIYLSRLPGLQRVDFRVEGVSTDPMSWRSVLGRYMYWEGVQVQGYTNKSFLMGDAIGRQGKGGQAWLTYHLSPSEMIQASYRHSKADSSFLPGGTTQNSFDVHMVKRLRENIELSADIQQEWWKAPIYKAGQNDDTVATFQLTIYPEHGITVRKAP